MYGEADVSYVGRRDSLAGGARIYKVPASAGSYSARRKFSDAADGGHYCGCAA
jgi:hypothetical protein